MNQIRMKDFIIRLDSDREPGLVICENPEAVKNVSEILINQGFEKVSDWKELSISLQTPEKIFMILEDQLSKEMYDALAQFATGGIEMMDSATLEKEMVNFNPREISFVIISEEKNLKRVEETMPIKNKVGITEVMS